MCVCALGSRACCLVQVARLLWSSASEPKRVVPSSRLFYDVEPIVASPFAVAPVGVYPTRPTGAGVAINTANSLTVTWFAPVNDGGAPVLAYTVDWFTTLGTNEVQTVSISGASGGTYRLSLLGGSTVDLAYNAAPSVVAAALGAIDNVGQVTVSCLGSPAIVDAACPSGNLVVTLVTYSGTPAVGTIDIISSLTPSITAKTGVCEGASSATLLTSLTCVPGTTNVARVARADYCATTDSGSGSLSGPSGTPALVTGVALDVAPGSPFSYVITGLVPGVTYYVRVYATNIVGALAALPVPWCGCG